MKRRPTAASAVQRLPKDSNRCHPTARPLHAGQMHSTMLCECLRPQKPAFEGVDA